MWLWECELYALGFRRRSRRYWNYERRFGLSPEAYVSIFADVEGKSAGRGLIQFNAFHVTFLLDVDNVHFYYHEHSETEWEPGGYTSSAEIERHGVCPRSLRDHADAIAGRVVAAWRNVLMERSW